MVESGCKKKKRNFPSIKGEAFLIDNNLSSTHWASLIHLELGPAWGINLLTQKNRAKFSQSRFGFSSMAKAIWYGLPRFRVGLGYYIFCLKK